MTLRPRGDLSLRGAGSERALVLVVDDTKTMRRLVRVLLEDEYSIIEAKNGKEAFEVAVSERPDVIVSDLQMPVLDGLGLVAQLKAHAELKLVPVIVLTTRGGPSVASVLDAGADDFLHKPFEADELKARVKAACRLRQSIVEIGEKSRELDAARLQLIQREKLALAGQISAGVAHEINTPIQYVGDSVYFLKEAFEDLMGLVGHVRTMGDELARGGREDLLVAFEKAQQDADVEFLTEQVPKAIDRVQDGVARVAHIVRAMKQFARPDLDQMALSNLNHAIESTLVIATSELNRVADIDTQLGALPEVSCHVGELNQVFLNLLINAAHAIGDVMETTGERGRITVSTRAEASTVIVEIRDTGKGIPEAIRDRIFEPFFTTKEVGKGTGQGLAIARTIVVEKHHGRLRFESEVGKGTTFFVELPIARDP